MIIRREALRAAMAATTADDTRYFLNSVQIMPDGSIRGTDGHIGLIASEPSPFPIEDFPLVRGADNLEEPSAPILLPVDVAKRLIDGTPKGKRITLPILAGIRIGLAGVTVLGASTDLTAPTVAEIPEPSGSFPDLTRVIPAADTPDTIALTLGVEVLENLIKAKKAISPDAHKGSMGITFYVPTRQPACEDAIRVEMKGSEVQIVGAAMPMRT